MPDAREREAFLRSALHPTLAIGVSFAFVQAMDAIVRGGIFASDGVGPTGMLVVVLLAGVSQVITANILGRERITGAGPRVREFVVTIAGCFVLLMLLTGRPFRGDLSLQQDMAWPLVLCGAQWLVTLGVQEELRARELFLRLVERARARGQLTAAYYASSEAGVAHVSFRRLQSLSIGLQVAVMIPWVILTMVRSYIGAPGLGFLATARIFLSVLCGVVFIVILHGFMDEHAVLGARVASIDARATQRYGGPVVGTVLLFAVSLGLAGGRALLPLDLIARFFAWLNRLGQGAMLSAMSGAGMPQIDPSEALQLQTMVPTVPSRILETVFAILGFLLAAAVAAGIAWFLVRPLVRRGLFRAMRQFHPLRATAQTVLAFLRFVAGLPGRFLRWARTPRRGLASISRAIIAGIRERAEDPARAERARHAALRATRGRAVREFRRLARWGERRGIVLRAAEAPLEYAVRLSPAAPAKEQSLREAARVFELLVYSHAPGQGEERTLARIVNGIVR